MLNSVPNNSNYHQGNYIPKYKNKVIKLNTKGGVYYRSGLEKKFMHWLDHKKEIISWCGECISIPYQLKHYENGDIKIKNHIYYSDFFYKMRTSDGGLKQVVVEVKPMKEYKMVIDLINENLKMPEKKTPKKLKNFEYDLKMAQKNRSKWETITKWCDKKGYHFIIITEEHLKNK